MGLKSHDDPLEVHCFHRVDQGFQFAGMMGIVIIDLCAVAGALEFHSAARTRKGGKSGTDRLRIDAHDIGGSCGSEGVINIVPAIHAQIYMAVGLTTADNIKGTVVLRQILRINIVLFV